MTTEDLIDEARSHLRALERGEVVVGMPLTLRFMVSALEKEREDHDMTRRKLSAMIAVVDSRGEQIDTLRAKLTKAVEALALAYSDCRILADAYERDNRPPGEVVKRCLALSVNTTDAALKAIGEGA